LTAMTLQTVRELLSRRPFTPLRVMMSSGVSFEVHSREMALKTRSDLVVGIDETNEGVPAEFKICSLSHVAAIEPLSAAGS